MAEFFDFLILAIVGVAANTGSVWPVLVFLAVIVVAAIALTSAIVRLWRKQ